VDAMDLKNYFKKKDILAETLIVLKKDFRSVGEEINVDVSDSVTFEELVRIMLPVVEKLYFTSHQNFMALLYRVDIPEKLFQEIFKRNTQNPLAELTENVIKRELQKVVIKHFYKNND
jgi:hypothetical protein